MNGDKILYLDCSCGISGDMFVGAMLGLGVDGEHLKQALLSLGLDDFDIKLSKTNKCGIVAEKFDVILNRHEHTHRHLADINRIIDKSPLESGVKKLSKKIFGIVANAEGAVHGLPAEKVHFHEVGAADSIADIVAAAVCLEEIAPKKVLCSPLCVGGGSVVCEHGTFAVPAPATAEILRAAKVPFYTKGSEGEAVTPTGAAIAAAVSGGFCDMPQMTVEKIGCGAGTKDFSYPNIFRVFLGTAAEENIDSVEVLETCVDDTSGEALAFCVDALFATGARDAYFTPIFMKKGRPAYMLTVICDESLTHIAAKIIFERTGSIGIRLRNSKRIVMHREIKSVATKYGSIPVKYSSFDGIEKFKAEADAVEKAAKAFGVPPSEVYEQTALALKNKADN